MVTSACSDLKMPRLQDWMTRLGGSPPDTLHGDGVPVHVEVLEGVDRAVCEIAAQRSWSQFLQVVVAGGHASRKREEAFRDDVFTMETIEPALFLGVIGRHVLLDRLDIRPLLRGAVKEISFTRLYDDREVGVPPQSVQHGRYIERPLEGPGSAVVSVCSLTTISPSMAISKCVVILLTWVEPSWFVLDDRSQL